ncbi:hypothetical protein E2320_014229 [Naja naja]|nr:hypothetical protein E2320_014229 [Naja naja]
MGSNWMDHTNLSPDLSFRGIPRDRSQVLDSSLACGGFGLLLLFLAPMMEPMKGRKRLFPSCLSFPVDKMESTLLTESSPPVGEAERATGFLIQKKENDQEPNLVPLQIIKTEIPGETSTNKRGRRKSEKKHNWREKSILECVEMDRFLTQPSNSTLSPLKMKP